MTPDLFEALILLWRLPGALLVAVMKTPIVHAIGMSLPLAGPGCTPAGVAQPWPSAAVMVVARVKGHCHHSVHLRENVAALLEITCVIELPDK
jgi:hypothetical protein